MIYNNLTNKWEDYSHYIYRGIVYIDHTYVEFGFFKITPFNIPLMYNGIIVYLDNIDHCKVPLYWINSDCVYSIYSGDANNIKRSSKDQYNYPIKKCYNFSKLSLSPKKLKNDLCLIYKPLSKFTIGLEYETSKGNIPWIECLDKGLVPLYDGSISGHEYVSFPLSYSNFEAIKDHLLLLDKYTEYDKNCALHIHFGGFPINYDKIDILCKSWYIFQNIISKYIPEWSYYVEHYKDNGKAYNKPFPKISSLEDFYNKFTGNYYENEKSFYLPNLYDVDQIRKWQVKGRYFNMNIMHLISNDAHKTVEFRFLHPTTNYSEIKWYIIVLGSFLNYVIGDNIVSKKTTLHDILLYTYSEEDVEKIENEGMKLYHLKKIQINCEDFAGISDFLKTNYLKLRDFNI